MREQQLADVVVVSAAPSLAPFYTYRVPPTLQAVTRPGICVHVPFGKQELTGYVLAVRDEKTTGVEGQKLKDILAVLHGAVTFNEEQSQFAARLSEETLCELQAAIRCIAPAAMGAGVRVIAALTESPGTRDWPVRSHVQAAILSRLASLGGSAEREALRRQVDLPGFPSAYSALLKAGLVTETRYIREPKAKEKVIKAYVRIAGDRDSGSLSAAAKRVLEAFGYLSTDANEPVTAIEILEAAQASPGVLKTLETRGYIRPARAIVERSPHRMLRSDCPPTPLIPQQMNAIERISRLLSAGVARTALLYGVTASGKTEVYMAAVETALAAGRTAIMLVPEIALTDQVVHSFVGRFGDEVAVLHSRLSGGERHDEWRRLQAGRARIAIGARSAVFAPLDRIGLIAVDEEHEASYKQESAPRYHAARAAEWRVGSFGATVLLGSATPSVETFHRSETGEIERIEMSERIGARPLPEVRVVDMREELRTRRALFSRELEDRMREAIAAGGQCILFLNRRGYSRFLLCRDCGETIRCPNCAVSLTLHANVNLLRCHHCGYGRRPPSICPSCSGSRVLGFGLGTEKVEAEVSRVFPNAKVLRMDRDTTTAKGAHGKLLAAFRKGEANVLIGTQMVAKGLDFPRVTVVGVVSADTSLNVPDFRAPERCFQLLTQVSGRAGRGDQTGVAVLQSFRPEHYAVEAAVRHDYRAFYDAEIEFRRELRYPPFSRLAGFLCTGTTDAAARRVAEAVAAALREVVGKQADVLGPSPAPLHRIQNRFRWRAALRVSPEEPLPSICRRVLQSLPESVRLAVIADIDPQNMV